MVGIVVLTWFRRCGHTPVALLGGATGRVGDPSGAMRSRGRNGRIDRHRVGDPSGAMRSRGRNGPIDRHRVGDPSGAMRSRGRNGQIERHRVRDPSGAMHSRGRNVQSERSGQRIMRQLLRKAENSTLQGLWLYSRTEVVCTEGLCHARAWQTDGWLTGPTDLWADSRTGVRMDLRMDGRADRR
jgi:hypothetical protein